MIHNHPIRHLTPTQAEHKAIWDEIRAERSGRTTCGRPRTAAPQARCVDCGRKAFDAIQGQALCVRHMGERAREMQETSK